MPMEPRGAVFQMDPLTGGMTFWTSTQAPHWNRNEIAKALTSTLELSEVLGLVMRTPSTVMTMAICGTGASNLSSNIML